MWHWCTVVVLVSLISSVVRAGMPPAVHPTNANSIGTVEHRLALPGACSKHSGSVCNLQPYTGIRNKKSLHIVSASDLTILHSQTVPIGNTLCHSVLPGSTDSAYCFSAGGLTEVMLSLDALKSGQGIQIHTDDHRPVLFHVSIDQRPTTSIGALFNWQMPFVEQKKHKQQVQEQAEERANAFRIKSLTDLEGKRYIHIGNKPETELDQPLSVTHSLDDEEDDSENKESVSEARASTGNPEEWDSLLDNSLCLADTEAECVWLRRAVVTLAGGQGEAADADSPPEDTKQQGNGGQDQDTSSESESSDNSSVVTVIENLGSGDQSLSKGTQTDETAQHVDEVDMLKTQFSSLFSAVNKACETILPGCSASDRTRIALSVVDTLKTNLQAETETDKQKAQNHFISQAEEVIARLRVEINHLNTERDQLSRIADTIATLFRLTGSNNQIAKMIIANTLSISSDAMHGLFYRHGHRSLAGVFYEALVQCKFKNYDHFSLDFMLGLIDTLKENLSQQWYAVSKGDLLALAESELEHFHVKWRNMYDPFERKFSIAKVLIVLFSMSSGDQRAKSLIAHHLELPESRLAELFDRNERLQEIFYSGIVKAMQRSRDVNYLDSVPDRLEKIVRDLSRNNFYWDRP